MKKIYLIGIGGIGISGLARYYKHIGYDVYGTDLVDSPLIETLKKEGIKINIGEYPELIDDSFELVVHSEGVPTTQKEIQKAISLGVPVYSYPKALGEVANKYELISVAGTHGKSTTSSLVSLILRNSPLDINSIVGTLLKEFDGKNTHFSDSKYFVVESCEYKRAFLNYKQYIGVITNIEADHLDYYKDLDDYISAFEEFSANIKQGGYLILNGEDKNSTILRNLRSNINYIIAYDNFYTFLGESYYYPNINMQVPGRHILYDAKLAYIVGRILGVQEKTIVSSLENYKGVWRRMELIKETDNNNKIISDYGHHPTEIKLTIEALREKYPKNTILTVYQPHQYSRTIELLDDFKNAFLETDKLIIPNIYASRDTEEDKKKINTLSLLNSINHNDKTDGEGLENTAKLIKEFDEKHKNSIILIMGAGDVDNLRYMI